MKETENLKVMHLPGNIQPADIFTKALGHIRFAMLRRLVQHESLQSCRAQGGKSLEHSKVSSEIVQSQNPQGEEMQTKDSKSSKVSKQKVKMMKEKNKKRRKSIQDGVYMSESEDDKEEDSVQNALQDRDANVAFLKPEAMHKEKEIPEEEEVIPKLSKALYGLPLGGSEDWFEQMTRRASIDQGRDPLMLKKALQEHVGYITQKRFEASLKYRNQEEEKTHEWLPEHVQSQETKKSSFRGRSSASGSQAYEEATLKITEKGQDQVKEESEEDG